MIADNYNLFSETKFWYSIIKIIKIYDGDSPTVMIDRGFNDFKIIEMRIENVDCPEQKTQEGKIVTKLATKFLSEPYKIMICKSSEVDKDKYGRILGDIICDGQSYSQWLINNKLARKYNGLSKPAWTQEQIDYILNLNF